MGSGDEDEIDVHSDPNSGSERFMSLKVKVCPTESPPEDWFHELDRTAKKRLREMLGEPPYAVVAGRLAVAWKNENARAACIEYQRTRKLKGRTGTRWDDVQLYAQLLKAGKFPKIGPVFVHPAAWSSSQGLMQAVDGTRRTMAAAEAQINEVAAVYVIGRKAAAEVQAG